MTDLEQATLRVSIGVARKDLLTAERLVREQTAALARAVRGRETAWAVQRENQARLIRLLQQAADAGVVL